MKDMGTFEQIITEMSKSQCFWTSQAEILVKSIGIGIEVLDFGPVLVLVLVLTLREIWVLVLVLVLTSGQVQVLVLVLVLTFGGMRVLVLVLVLTSAKFWYWYWYWPLKNGIAGVCYLYLDNTICRKIELEKLRHEFPNF